MNHLSLLLFGFFLGLEHALEPDHIMAVANVSVVSERWKQAIKAGFWWGIGHTASIGVLVTAIYLFQWQITDQIANYLEVCVAGTLIVLGGNILYKLVRKEAIHVHAHRHNDFVHVHPHYMVHHSLQEHQYTTNVQSLVVGVFHGFAGTAALVALMSVLFTSWIDVMLYISVFGIGNILGMILASTVIYFHIHIVFQYWARWVPVIQGGIGTISILMGFFILYKTI